MRQREEHVFDPELLELIAAPDGWEWDDLDPPPEEWWWDPEYTVHLVPDELKDRVLDEFERCNPGEGDETREALYEPDSILRLMDYEETVVGDADLEGPSVDKGFIARNGELVFLQDRFSSMPARRKSGWWRNWENHLIHELRHFYPREEIPRRPTGGGNIQAFRNVLVDMYNSIPWRTVVSVFVCLGGRNQEKDRPDTAYSLPEDKLLKRLHDEMEYVLTDMRPLDEVDRARMRESWDAAEAMWRSRTGSGDPQETADRVRELFDNLPQGYYGLSGHALDVHNWIIEEFVEAVCGVAEYDEDGDEQPRG